MRQIKFRGKRIDNGEWVEGFLVGSVNPHKVETEYDSWFIHTGVNISSFLRVDPATVGQFTGLLDKNGKEIYEGGICKWPSGHKSEITWDSDRACFTTKSLTQSGNHGRYGIVTHYIEIIGNIHDKK